MTSEKIKILDFNQPNLAAITFSDLLSKSLKIKNCASSVLERNVENRKWDDSFEDLDQLYQQMYICNNKFDVLYPTNHKTVSTIV